MCSHELIQIIVETLVDIYEKYNRDTILGGGQGIFY